MISFSRVCANSLSVRRSSTHAATPTAAHTTSSPSSRAAGWARRRLMRRSGAKGGGPAGRGTQAVIRDACAADIEAHVRMRQWLGVEGRHAGAGAWRWLAIDWGMVGVLRMTATYMCRMHVLRLKLLSADGMPAGIGCIMCAAPHIAELSCAGA